MSVIHTPRQATLDERQLLVPGLVVIAIIVFLSRLWYLQVIHADRLAAMGESTGIDVVKSIAPRGRIVDRNGIVIAGVKQNAVVTAVYDTVIKNPETIDEVARLLGVPREKLDKPLKEASWDPYVPNVIFVGASPEAASIIAEAGDRLPGFGVVLQPTREYIEPTALTHTLGYVWKPTEKEVKALKAEGLEPMPYVGRDGLEQFYEKLLMGTAGAERIAVDPQMRPLRTVSTDRPVPGQELVLALDLRLQRLATQALGGRPGAVVATDPRTGEVLCMVSSPTYDIHLWDNGISSVDYDRLSQDKLKPFLKRAIAGAYQPGSTYKIVTSIAAEMGGVFDAYRRVTCNGSYRLGNRAWTCLGRHGAVDFNAAMAASCNVYFYDLAMRAGQVNMQKAIEALGLGEKQGIDLPGESRGIAPTPEQFEKMERKWQPYDTMNVGIGQGPLALTPLQMLSVVSTVANNGVAYKPHLLKASRDAENRLHPIDPQALIKLDLPASFWSTLRSALFAVVDHGTAGSYKIPGMAWGGKTGSAQNSHGPMAHGWFVGLAPIDAPRIAIAVIVENAGHGGVVAAPIAKEIVDKYLNGKMGLIPEVQSTVRPLNSPRTSSTALESPEAP